MDSDITVQDSKALVVEKLEYLKTSRPTAVNLFDMVDKMTLLINKAGYSTSKDLFQAFIVAAENMFAEDVLINKAIGHFGSQWLSSRHPGENQMSVLTHCNTGYT